LTRDLAARHVRLVDFQTYVNSRIYRIIHRIVQPLKQTNMLTVDGESDDRCICWR